MLLVLESVSVPCLPSMCLDDIKLGIGIPVATFWKRAAHRVCSLCVVSLCIFGYYPFWFRGQDFGSDCTSSWSLLTFYFS